RQCGDSMRNFAVAVLILLTIICETSAPVRAAEGNAASAAAPAANERPDAAACLGCHGNEGFSMPAADGSMRPLHVDQASFEASAHGKYLVCVDCHQDITEIPHNMSKPHKVECGNCHTQQKEQYLGSVHGRAVAGGNKVA